MGLNGKLTVYGAAVGLARSEVFEQKRSKREHICKLVYERAAAFGTDGARLAAADGKGACSSCRRWQCASDIVTVVVPEGYEIPDNGRLLCSIILTAGCQS